MTQTTQLQSTTHNGETIRYLDTGTGDPPIVFVHGWCCNHTYWRDQIPVFAANHRVIAVDLPGHGESDKPDRDYTIDNFVDVVATLIKELNLDRPVVVGHSMGGTIAMALARMHPKLVRGIVPVDAPVVPIPDDRRPMVDGLLAALTTPTYAAVGANFVRTMFKADSDPALVEEVVAGMTGAPQHVMHSALVETLDVANSPAGALSVPALFIRAETAHFTEQALRERYPGIGVTTVNVGHFVQMERPAETNAAIQKFIEQVR